MQKFEFEYIPVEKLLPNPLRPRFSVKREKILQLADSIRQYGIFNPILVGKTAAGLQIIAGEQRWKAAKVAGLNEVPAMVIEASSLELILLFLEENLRRTPINLLEEATAINRLLDKDGVTMETVASRLKKTEEELETLLQTLELPSRLKESYIDGKISDKELLEKVTDEDAILSVHKSDT